MNNTRQYMIKESNLPTLLSVLMGMERRWDTVFGGKLLGGGEASIEPKGEGVYVTRI